MAAYEERAQIAENQLEKIAVLLKGYKPDFNFEVEHWDNGNFDDSYEYGVEVGEQYVLETLSGILN